MNRRHNLSDVRLVKKEYKEIKKGIRTDTPIVKKITKTQEPLKPLTPIKHRKKTSKRDSTGEDIENSSPSYPHKEGGAWIKSLKAQESNKTVCFTKKASKYKG